MVMVDLLPAGNYVSVRPSGTEPKVKFYLFAFEPPELCGDLAAAKRLLDQRLSAMETGLKAATREGEGR